MLQPIIDIAEICSQHGIRHVVLSPGSRCAPLTLAMVRHPKLKTYTITDERSAAFIALGLSQSTGLPTVLICTSGSAGLNYAPGVAEAFYQRIPLLVLTADRPPEWIDQQDGQTISQEQLFGRHVKNSFSLPVDLSHPDAQWQVNRTVNQAILETTSTAPGPVHINVPLREPFYPEDGAAYGFSKNVRVIKRNDANCSLSDDTVADLLSSIEPYRRILVVPGQQKPWKFLAPVEDFCKNTGAVLVTDMISNQSISDIAIRHHDLFIKNKKLAESLRPDLLITYGGSVISKNLKEFIRQNKPQEHWHISLEPTFADTFQSLTSHVISTAPDFFTALNGKLKSVGTSESYQQKWHDIEEMINTMLEMDFTDSFTEMTATQIVLEAIPQGNCHFANSMPVRYANMLNPNRKDLSIYCNRGTSGIDGSTSTAVGMALATDRHVTLITGDLAFFYDRNGLWNKYLPSNLTIVVMNNHAGGIFRLVEGASKQPELEEYFETEQPLNAELTALQHGLEYFNAKTAEELREIFKLLSKQQERSRIIEIEIDSTESAAYLRSLQSKINEEINNHY